jgi:preprotein translocase subunit SecE
VAKSRAQRKAERRRREAQQARQKQSQADQAKAQHDTQVPESADVLEAELAEHGVDLDALREAPPDREGDGAAVERAPVEPEEPVAPAPSRADVGAPEDKLSRRERRRQERERRQRAKESERRRQPKEEPVERKRGFVLTFLSQVVAELRRVQWPDRPHLIQASAVTLVFIALLAAYLGALDVVFNWLVQQIL